MSQLTVHIRVRSHEVKRTDSRAQRHNCMEAQTWERKITSAALKVPETTKASIILKCNRFGRTRTFPRDDCHTNLSKGGKRVSGRHVIKNSMIT